MSVLKKYNSITSQWDSIVVGSSGPQGAQGAQGANGAQGAQGPQGAPAATVVTSSTRPSSPTSGQIIYETDTNRLAAYNGSSWITQNAWQVVKSETSFSSATSVTADSVFSSQYTNYMMIVRYTTSGATGISMKLRTGGSSVSSNYNRHLLATYGTTVSASNSTGQTAFEIAAGYGSEPGFTLVFLNQPFIASTTVITATDTHFVSNTDPQVYAYTGNHAAAASYDGVELIGNTMTGNYTIWGMRAS